MAKKDRPARPKGLSEHENALLDHIERHPDGVALQDSAALADLVEKKLVTAETVSRKSEPGQHASGVGGRHDRGQKITVYRRA